MAIIIISFIYNMLKYIMIAIIKAQLIDERYDYDVCDASSITWYREGYIMFRYMYNKNKVGMFYNKTTDTYFY